MEVLTHDTARRGQLRAGLACALAASAAFGLSGALAGGLLNAGWNAPAVVAARMLVGGIALLPFALAQLRGEWNLLRRNISLIITYALMAVTVTQLAYFNAVAHGMTIGAALLVEYTAPIAVVGWLWLRHHQRPGRATILGAAIGIGGLFLVLDPASGMHTSWIGIAWALCAMVGAAGYFVLNARGGDALPGTVLAAGGLLLGGTAILAVGWSGIVPLHASTSAVNFQGHTVAWWLPVLGLGVVSAALAYTLGIAATRLLGSRLASFAALSEVVAAIAFAWALLGQAPHWIQLLGGALILGGVLVVQSGESDDSSR